MGYLPGTLWILAGVVFAGAVQDFIILFISTRRDGRSLGDLIRPEMGPVAGVIALFGVLTIMVILLAVLALVVVKALADSPWGTFTVFATIPIAMLMGVYVRFIRPGRIGEMSVIGFVLLIARASSSAQTVSESPTLAPDVHLQRRGAGADASSATASSPRCCRCGCCWRRATICRPSSRSAPSSALAIGILIVQPELQMPAVTQFIDGTGPVFAGSLFPFLFITIACGAVSGFHALIASGTTPKMLENEAPGAAASATARC